MNRSARLLGSFLLLTGLLGIAVSPVSAATPKRVWQAQIGSSRVLGSATLTLYPSYTGTIQVGVQSLRAGTSYSTMIYKGTCHSPIALVRLPNIRTDGAGNGTRTTALSLSSGAAIWATAANGGSIAVRVASGATTYCAKLSYPIATRVQISRYGIDLPIVHQPAGLYPYCNVAMYASALSQPGEAGPTFIYAHARVGMFLPLLTASQNNAGSMVGTTVRIWTSDSQLHVYQITQVLRHQYSTPAYDPRVETLWLQTSEGPHGTKNKLFLLAHQISVENASYAEAHPRARIVVCH